MKQFCLRMPDDMFDWLETKQEDKISRQKFIRNCLEQVRLGKTGHVFSDDIEAWIKDSGGEDFLTRLLIAEKKKAEHRKEIAKLNEGECPFE